MVGNPCRNVYSYQHLEKVAETVIVDEVYGHLAFGDLIWFKKNFCRKHGDFKVPPKPATASTSRTLRSSLYDVIFSAILNNYSLTSRCSSFYATPSRSTLSPSISSYVAVSPPSF
ncbi:hypothetical protein ACFX11_040440 [Malus domestica]